MVHFYAGDITTLSDADLKSLSQELVDSGVLSIEDIYDYDAGDWRRQAYSRYRELEVEQRRRWEVANPEEAERQRIRHKPVADIFASILTHWQKGLHKTFEDSAAVAALIRKS